MTTSSDHPDRLTPLVAFGSNPGALLANTYIPKGFRPGGPLVVVLHGSTQSAEGYDGGSGWSALADEYGIALLFPEQRISNNFKGAFNWFRRGDSGRGYGEPLSIRHMIDDVVTEHAIDPFRVFITGLSSGGAMTSVMLATYPEVFAGGAIIAGLPYRTANTLMQALYRMKGYSGPSDRQLTALVRDASDNSGPWPTISVWHGARDRTVDMCNADSIVRQWQQIHQVEGPPGAIEHHDGYTRQVWTNAQGRVLIDEILIKGMDHGTPIGAAGKKGLGREGAYMLEVGISSTRIIADAWGLMK